MGERSPVNASYAELLFYRGPQFLHHPTVVVIKKRNYAMHRFSTPPFQRNLYGDSRAP
jgi:hypothetical protein